MRFAAAVMSKAISLTVLGSGFLATPGAAAPASHRLITLRNKHGLSANISSYGGTVLSLLVPDRQGHLDDVVLGFDRLDEYKTGTSYFGAVVGRYANRLARGRFELDGRSYQLPVNDGVNHLHGGRKGFDKVEWQVDRQTADAVDLSYVSPDGEEGYPGRLTVHVRYTLTPDDALQVDYQATTDQATVVNLSQHSYFNLAGRAAEAVLDHEMIIDADAFTPVDATLIPTGELRSVGGTPFDFRKGQTIGARIKAADEQLKFGKGYDHNFVLRGPAGAFKRAARVHEPKLGRVLEVWTTQPGVQFYSGNLLDGKQIGKDGVAYPQHAGFCLETQHFPDAPNHPEFASTVLRPGADYHEVTEYRFSSDAGWNF